MIKYGCWVLLFVSTVSGSCFAGEENKWFVGPGVGKANYSSGSFSSKDDADMSSVSAGYSYRDVFSVEVAYVDLGGVRERLLPDGVVSLDQDTLVLDVKGYTIASVLSMLVTDSAVFSGKLGVSVLDVEKRYSGGTFVNPVLANDTGGTETGIFTGFQLKYRMNESFSLGLNWDRFRSEEIDIDAVYGRVEIGF